MTDRSWLETPRAFGPDGTLIGTLAQPRTGADPQVPCVIFLNAGIIHRSGPSRMYVRLARALAEVGFASLRFDLGGVGDSGTPTEPNPRSLRDRAHGDLVEALGLCREALGARRFVLLGLCSGADNALRSAGRSEEVAGVVLLDLNVERTWGYHLRYYGSRLIQPSFWRRVVTGQQPLVRGLLGRVGLRLGEGAEAMARPTFSTALSRDEAVDAIGRMRDRDARLLAVFTGDVEFQYNHEGQFRGLVSEVDIGDRLTEVYRPEADHSFEKWNDQEWLLRTVTSWMATTPFPGRTDPEPR